MPAHLFVIPLKKGIHKYLYRSRIPSASLRAGKSGMTNRKGFTLIELLIVISIIAVLSVIGITVFSGVQKGVREAKRKGDIEAIAKAYEVKYNTTGTYSALKAEDFAGGKIPTPDGTDKTSYFVAGSNSSSATDKNFAVCAPLDNAASCSGNSPTCVCKFSTQGDPVDTFSLGNPVVNGSFETPGSNGLAANWNAPTETDGRTTIGTLLQSDTINTSSGTIIVNPKEGQFMQKAVAGQYVGIHQIITVPKANTVYKATAWVFPVRTQACTDPDGVGVGMLFGGPTVYTYCKESNTWVQLTVQATSDSQSKIEIYFGNWATPTFYVDEVRLEEVK